MSNPNRDFVVQNPPNDSISAIAFSPKNNLMVASSWNKQVCLWDVQSNGTAVPKIHMSHNGPVLCCNWLPVSARPPLPPVLIRALDVPSEWRAGHFG